MTTMTMADSALDWGAQTTTVATTNNGAIHTRILAACVAIMTLVGTGEARAQSTPSAVCPSNPLAGMSSTERIAVQQSITYLLTIDPSLLTDRTACEGARNILEGFFKDVGGIRQKPGLSQIPSLNISAFCAMTTPDKRIVIEDIRRELGTGAELYDEEKKAWNDLLKSLTSIPALTINGIMFVIGWIVFLLLGRLSRRAR